MLRIIGIAVSTLVLGLAVVLWSAKMPTSIDAWWPWPPPPAGALSGQLVLAWAHTLQPVTAYLTMIVLAVILGRRGWRDHAGALLLAIVFTVSIVTVTKSMVARLRPATDWIGSLHIDASYPSGHAAAVAALGIAIVQATWTLTRRLRPTVAAAVAGSALAAAVAVGRLYLGVHHVTDVVGGVLCAAFGAALAAAVAGSWRVTSPIWRPRTIQVVWNPLRVRALHSIQRRLASEARRRGCEAPVWVATTSPDDGAHLAADAVAAGADLVIVVGGDGTLRQVLSGVGSTVDTAVLPVGSANVLALNTGVPRDLSRAIERALDAPSKPIDLLKVTVDGGDVHSAVAMVGAGADAAVLADTSEGLKGALGPVAYLVAGTGHVRADPTEAVVTVDSRSYTVDASLITVGNVGSLYPGLTLLPTAAPDDGVLDVLVATPRSTRQVLAMMAAVLSSKSPLPHSDLWVGRSVQLDFARPVPFHVDGDSLGRVSCVTVEVMRDAANLV